MAEAGSGKTLLVVSSARCTCPVDIAALFDPGPDLAVARAHDDERVEIKLIVGASGVNSVSFNEHMHLSDIEGGIATFR